MTAAAILILIATTGATHEASFPIDIYPTPAACELAGHTVLSELTPYIKPGVTLSFACISDKITS